MRQSGILIDPSKHKIIRDVIYDDTPIESMYYKVEGELTPIAYIFPKSNQLKVEELLVKARELKKWYDDYVEDMYYKQFPTLRK